MKKIISLISIAVLLLSAFSCRKNSYEIPEQYKTAEPLAVKGSASVEFDAEGGKYTVAVQNNSNDLEVSVSSAWLKSSISGQNVVLSCDENMTLEIRYSVVTISSNGKSRRLHVKQFGVSNDYLWEESYDFSGNGGTLSLKFLPVSGSIKLKIEGSEWIKAVVTENSLDLTVAKNETTEERAGQVTWQAGEDVRVFAVTQAKGTGGGGTNPPAGGVIFSEDFEDESTLDAWKFLDLDGDDHNWNYSSQLAAHSGIGMLFSQSYINNVGALNPDNWAFTPSITFSQNSYVSFWLTAQDPSYKNEHYAVYLSDKLPESQADLDAMTKLVENTFPEGNPAQEEDLTFNDKVYTWQRFVLQVPAAFEGKTGYVVFRHFDCTDMYYLNLDDVMVTVGAPSTTSTSVAPASISRVPSTDFERK